MTSKVNVKNLVEGVWKIQTNVQIDAYIANQM